MDAAPAPPLAPPAPAPAPAPEIPKCQSCGQQIYQGEIRPGMFLRHRFVRVETIMVLELEGDGSNGWFTARFPDMSTWRLRREEVEIVPALKLTDTHPGQYL